MQKSIFIFQYLVLLFYIFKVMKTINQKISYLLLATSFIVVVSCSESSSDSTEETTTEISVENVIVSDYSIDGMVCAMGCAKTIQDELAETNGVAACEVDFESGKAHVEYDKTQLSENDIIALIEGMADGQYKVSEWKEEVEKEIEVEEGGETEESLTEVSLPSFEIPNLFSLLFNQL